MRWEQATGDYLLLLDSGDTLDRHAARTAFAAALDTDADVVSVGWEPRGNGPTRVGDAAAVPANGSYPAARPSALSCSTTPASATSCSARRSSAAPELRFLEEGTAGSLRLRHGRVSAGATASPSAATAVRAARRARAARAARSCWPFTGPSTAWSPTTLHPSWLSPKNVAFLEVDLPALPARLPRDDEDAALELLDPLHRLCGLARPGAFERIGKMAQIAVFMVRKRDTAGARSPLLTTCERGHVLPAGLFEQDGRVYWSASSPRHRRGPGGPRCDVVRLPRAPAVAAGPGARIDELHMRGGRAIGARDRRQPARPDRLGTRSSRCRSVRPAPTASVRFPSRWSITSRERLSWQGTLDLPAVVRPRSAWLPRLQRRAVDHRRRRDHGRPARGVRRARDETASRC